MTSRPYRSTPIDSPSEQVRNHQSLGLEQSLNGTMGSFVLGGEGTQLRGGIKKAATRKCSERQKTSKSFILAQFGVSRK